LNDLKVLCAKPIELNSKSVPKGGNPAGKLQPVNIANLFLDGGCFRKDHEGKNHDIS
jgi:hypothetical protein